MNHPQQQESRLALGTIMRAVPCGETIWLDDLENMESVQSLLSTQRQRVIEEVKNHLFIYTHQWTGDDHERFCENCRKVVKKWTVCEVSQLKANDLVSDLLSTLKEMENKTL